MTLIDQGKSTSVWDGDKLDRETDAEIIRTFSMKHLDLRENGGMPRTYVLNIDSDWGSGKTFFLSRFQKHLQEKGHVAVYINAWEDDHSSDPFMTVVDAIHTELLDSLPQEGTSDQVKAKATSLLGSVFKIAGSAAYSGGKHLAIKYIGQETVDVLGGSMTAEDGQAPADHQLLNEATKQAIQEAVSKAGQELLNNFQAQKEAQKNFKKQLEILSQEVLSQDNINSPIFILVDELDRCRPSYSVELLERIKHLFSIPNFVFVLGTDTEQLSHTIEGLYGPGFDGKRYLKRFLDRTYKFQTVPTINFVEFTMDRLGFSEAPFFLPGEFKPAEILSTCFSSNGVELRDAEQILEMMATFIAIWPSEEMKIDLFVLIKTTYMRHYNISEGDLAQTPLAKIELEFSDFRTRNPVIMPLSKIWAEIERRYDPERGYFEPTNDFQQWLLQKVQLEEDAFRKVFNKRMPRTSPTDEYQELLHRVTRIDD